ncbi:hypothetical protein SAVCW2_10810 [Streptomyces avermitilis]|uniref:Uncharacterized protein n=1 Tax=Streptomyces avermitilis TaxID=33903 RepID=A0A499W4I0_STRAX|nr:hypothetical protein SAVMC3_76250 [Streptomyces avermitilis]GDY81882.1 hypothetical protein SAVCW2_10810 [Streptomyces avermitilis]
MATAGAGLPSGSAAGLPGDLPGLRTACTAFWALSLIMLVTLLGARALHWIHHRDQARAHLLDPTTGPTTAPFYGCLAMALLAVGGATLTVGRDWLGTTAAVVLDAVLFTAGTAVGLAAAVAVPYLMVTRHRIEPGRATPVWLLPWSPRWSRRPSAPCSSRISRPVSRGRPCCSPASRCSASACWARS